jgi:hypothetical protein
MNITTPKLLEYTAKAVLLASSHVSCGWEENHISMKLIGAGRLTFTLPVNWSTTSIWVNIGDFEKYTIFIDKLLKRLNKFTGKTYTINDLNIY